MTRTNKHNHPRITRRNGREWVVRSVSNHRKIPGWHSIDPLTLPFNQRGSVIAKAARMWRLTLSETRGRLGTNEENPRYRLEAR